MRLAMLPIWTLAAFLLDLIDVSRPCCLPESVTYDRSGSENYEKYARIEWGKCVSRVFVGDGSGALAPYRQTAIEVCHRLGHKAVFMEEFDPRRPPPESIYRAMVESCDMLVLLLAHQYWQPTCRLR